MNVVLRPGWYATDIADDVDLGLAGVYQWTISGVGLYVGKAKVLRSRLRAYPRNVRHMLEGRYWHGDPTKEFCPVHHALRVAYETDLPVPLTILETCNAAARAERERWWIRQRRDEERRGLGPPVLNVGCYTVM